MSQSPTIKMFNRAASLKEDFIPDNFSGSPKRKVTIMREEPTTRESSDTGSGIGGMGSPSPLLSPKASSFQPSPLRKKASKVGFLDTIEERMISLARKSIKEKKNSRFGTLNDKTDPSKEAKTTPNHIKIECDYASLLMYVPENSHTKTARSASQPFSSFRELVKNNEDKRGKLLDNILVQEQKLRSHTPSTVNQVDRVQLVKKVLQFNKIQKVQVLRQASEQKKEILLPLIKQAKETAKRTPYVKIMPSRRLEGYGVDPSKAEEEKEEANVSNKKHMSSPSSPLGKKGGELKRSFSHEKTFEQMFATYIYKIFWAYNPTNNSWKPNVREGHTFTVVGKYAVLYGGLSNSLMEEIAIYDPAKNSWTRPQVSGEMPLEGRHGHTACEYKKSVVIFGGEHQFNPTLNIRECLNDVRLFDPEKCKWKYLKTFGQLVHPRRHHAAAIYDRTMYVYGGIDNEGIYTRDVYSLNLRNNVWDRIEVTGDKEPGIAFHTLCACFAERSLTSNVKEKDMKPAIAEEGIYVFGGRDGEGRILNTLKMFPVGIKEPQWKYINAKGIAPPARYNHTMIFYEPLGVLVIYGGRNDHLYETSGDVCLNDIRIFNLDQMAWSQVSSYGETLSVGRYRHAVAMLGSKMLIFGGVEFQKYADDEVKSIELNQGRVKRIIAEELSGDRYDDRRKSYSSSSGNDKKLVLASSIPDASELYCKEFVTFMPLPQTSKLGDIDRQLKMKIMGSMTSREKSSDSILAKFK